MIYSINEGQQAEEYKARKAKEAEVDNTDQKYGYDGRRSSHSYGMDLDNQDVRPHFNNAPFHPKHQQGVINRNERWSGRLSGFRTKEETDMYDAVDLENRVRDKEFKYARDIANKHVGTSPAYYSKEVMDKHERDYNCALDTARRHYRRHMGESCGIFSEVNFIRGPFFTRNERKEKKEQENAKKREILERIAKSLSSEMKKAAGGLKSNEIDEIISKSTSNSTITLDTDVLDLFKININNYMKFADKVLSNAGFDSIPGGMYIDLTKHASEMTVVGVRYNSYETDRYIKGKHLMFIA